MIIKSSVKCLLLFWLLMIPLYASEQDLSMLLLTPHYGILNQKDLELYAQNVNICPFDPLRGSGVEYWQCFKSQDVSVSYRSWDDELTDVYCEMEIAVNLNGKTTDFYGQRRACPVDYCQLKKLIWDKIMKNQKYVCLGGSYNGRRKMFINGKEIMVRNWVFDKIKTNVGCNAYFGIDCLNCLECPTE